VSPASGIAFLLLREELVPGLLPFFSGNRP
jgi:hypothetical protein